MKASWIDSWTRSREPAQQTWPWLNQIASTTPSTAESRSASSKTMNGDLPPSSSVSALPEPAVASRIFRPTSVEPVKAILSTPSWRTISSPVAPSPVTMLTTPAGTPAIWQISAKRMRGERRVLGRLEDDGVAERDRRGDLPGEHQERKIPRDDLAADADRYAVGELYRLELGPAGVMVEVAGDERHVDVAGLADRLAVVERLDHREEAAVLLDHAGDGVEVLGPLMAGQRRPFRLRLPGRGDRIVDIVGAGLGDAWPAPRRSPGRWCRRSGPTSAFAIRRR